MTGIRSDTSLTTLDDLLTLVPNLVNKYNSSLDPSLDQEDYLKVWKFLEENSNPEVVRSLPVSLQDSLSFKRTESYLFLFLFKQKAPRFFPPDLFKDIQHTSNLSPKGIKTPFLISNKNEIEFSIFISNGKHANPLLKAVTQTRAFELESHLNKYPSVLSSIFSGIYVKSKKIHKSDTTFLPYSSQKLFHDEFLIWNKFEKTEYLKHFHCPDPGKLFMNPYGVTLHKPKMHSLSLEGIANKSQEPESMFAFSNINEIENLDVRDTTRNELKLEFYNDKISEMAPGVFVAGQSVAKNKSLLKDKGVTHIINCAGNVVDNCFPEEFKYTTFYLKDSSAVNVECLFYMVFSIVEEALGQGGKVLIHCVQGVSRSVAVCIGYLVIKNQMDYETLLGNCKDVRGICGPNIGFQVQIIWWYKRLFGEFQDIPCNPRVFLVCSFDKDQEELVVVKMIMPQSSENFLDPRGIFIVYNEKLAYVWKGSQVPSSNEKVYWDVCQKYLELLKTYEKCPEPEQISENNEPQEFWQIWQDTVKVEKNPEWDDWLVSLERSKSKYSSSGEYSEDVENMENIENNEEKKEFESNHSENLIKSEMEGLTVEQNIEVLSVKSYEINNELADSEELE